MITILGSGGHGWQSLADFINNSGHEFEFWLLTVDWGQVNFGGFNGTWGRILEWENHKNNRLLHPLPKDSLMPILPCGDLNKILMYFWVQKLGNTGKNLDVRSDDLKTLQTLWQEIIVQTGFDSQLIQDFDDYLPQAFEVYLTGKKTLSLQARGPSLGYFWHTFLLWRAWQKVLKLDLTKQSSNFKQQSKLSTFSAPNQNLDQASLLPKSNSALKNGIPQTQSVSISSLDQELMAANFTEVMNQFNQFYHQSGLLPSRISLSFTNFEREILVGSDGLVDIVGEEILDEWEKPILPESLKLKTKELAEAEVWPGLLQKLEKTDWVIIPTGSVANWLPLVNEPVIKEILHRKNTEGKLIWLQNNQANTQELGMDIYQEYLQKLELRPEIITTVDLETAQISQTVAQKLEQIIN